MARRERKSRPCRGGSDLTDGRDLDAEYSGSESRASLSLAYVEPEWKSQLDRHSERPRRKIHWRSDGKVIRVDMKPDGWRIRQIGELFEVCKFMPSCAPQWRWAVLGATPCHAEAVRALEALLKDDFRPVWPEVR